MLAWQVPYLGWRHLPAELSEFEISRFFTFEPEVHRAIRSRYKDTLRLGVALQLGFLSMCERTLHAFQRVPAELLKRLGEQMDIPAPDIATLRALYKSRRATLFEHQAWAIEFLGFVRFELTDAPKLLPALRDVVNAGIDGDPLLASARRLLYEHRFVIPGTRRLGSLVQRRYRALSRKYSQKSNEGFLCTFEPSGTKRCIAQSPVRDRRCWNGCGSRRAISLLVRLTGSRKR